MVPVSFPSSYQVRSQSPKIGLIGKTSVRFLGFITLAILGLLYIAQTSQGATKQSTYQTSRSAAQELELQRQQLMLETVRLQSAQELSQDIGSLGLEPVDSAEYLK